MGKLIAILILLVGISSCGKPGNVTSIDQQCNGTPVNHYARCIGCDGKLVCDNCESKEQLVCPVVPNIARQI